MTVVTPGTATATTWKIDKSHTQVGFAVKHMMFSTVKGRFNDFSGEIHIDEAHPENSSVIVTIDAGSITTNEDKRDEHLRSADFFDVEKYPKLEFKSTSVESTGTDKFNINGDLTMHGVTNLVAIKAERTGVGTNPWGAEVSGFEATATLNRRDYGLTWNAALEKGGFLVGDEIKISIEVEANKV